MVEELDKALEVFGLNKDLFNQMKKKDIEIFIKTSIKTNPSELKITNGQILLQTKTNLKKVRIQEPIHSSSMEYIIDSNMYFSRPIGPSIDVLFSSLVTSNSINTLI